MKFGKGSGDNNLLYPVTKQQLDHLQDCQLASPMVGKEHAQISADAPKESELLELAVEVLIVRVHVTDGIFPRDFMEKYYPEEWGKFPDETPIPLQNEGLSFSRPQELADVVHMDNPMDLPNAVLSWVVKSGYKCKDARTNCNDFVEIIPETVNKLSNAVLRNLEKAFQAKYFYGVARPEEVLRSNMTSYPEGCPTHPSYPAGHGAAASAVSIILDRFDLDDYAIKQVRDSAYCWAMFRTFAGVHYGIDNVAGLKIGGLL